MEKKSPLVSIAIITYNQKEYLRECIESCLAQDYPNFEIVIADDCSTDGTQDMLRKYESAYPHKFVLRLADKNQGITENSNVCLDACRGEFITLVGGDDVFYQDKISKQVDFFKRNLDVVICGTYTNIIDENSEIIDRRIDYKRKKRPFYSQSELIESNNSLVPVVSYMVRRSALPHEGFDFRLPVASDSLFYFRIAEEGGIYIIKEYLTGYRVHKSHASEIGYRDDNYVSLALTEYYYPHCLYAINKARAVMYYSAARSLSKSKKFKEAEAFFLKSLAYNIKIKTIVGLLINFAKIKKVSL